MCGLVGFVNREGFKSPDKIQKWFKQALYCDALRGEHGTGITAVDGKGAVSTYKRALNATDFLELSRTKKIINDGTNVFMIGHNRWATQGSHSDENAHPFNYEHITLYHNGTISNWRSLANRQFTFNVDSDVVANLITYEDTPKDAIEKLEGTYSLVWYDDLSESICFARNEDRPMYFGLIKDSKSFLFASEPGMIKWLAVRNGIALEKIESTLENTIIEIPLNEKEKVRLTQFTPKKTITYDRTYYYPQTNKKKLFKGSNMENMEVVAKVHSWFPYNNTSSDTSLRNGYLKCNYNGITLTISGIQEKAGAKLVGSQIKLKINSITADNTGYANIVYEVGSVVNNVTQLPSLFKGPSNKKLTKKEFEIATKEGCSYCSCDISPNDHEKVRWDSQENVYCEECSESIFAE